VGPVIIIVWHQGMCSADLLRFNDITKAMAAAHKSGFAVLSFTYTDKLLPDADARATLMEINKVPTPEYRGSVVLLTGGGFGASVARSILAAMALVRKDRAKELVAKDVDEAVAKLAGMVACDGDAIRAGSADLLKSVGRTMPA
jgi:hypothetical protein